MGKSSVRTHYLLRSGDTGDTIAAEDYGVSVWVDSNTQRPEIDKFRGATQGDFEQGIFFATTSFSQGAIDASIKRGAVPIVLVDTDAIVDLMIKKQFGVQADNFVIPTYALDLALTPDNIISSDDSDLSSITSRTHRTKRGG